MYLRSNKRLKDGKEHRYYTVVESRRVGSGRVVQKQVLYLGEINDSQQAAWRKTLEVFDERQQRLTPLSLFAENSPVPADALDSVQLPKAREAVTKETFTFKLDKAKLKDADLNRLNCESQVRLLRRESGGPVVSACVLADGYDFWFGLIGKRFLQYTS